MPLLPGTPPDQKTVDLNFIIWLSLSQGYDCIKVQFLILAVPVDYRSTRSTNTCTVRDLNPESFNWLIAQDMCSPEKDNQRGSTCILQVVKMSVTTKDSPSLDYNCTHQLVNWWTNYKNNYNNSNNFMVTMPAITSLYTPGNLCRLWSWPAPIKGLCSKRQLHTIYHRRKTYHINLCWSNPYSAYSPTQKKHFFSKLVFRCDYGLFT